MTEQELKSLEHEFDKSSDGIDMNVPPRILSSREVYRGAIFSVEDREIELTKEDGSHSVIRRQIVCHPQAVELLVKDENTGKYLAGREYRVGENSYAYDFPAGLMDPGEEVQAAALRELEEETGVVPVEGAYEFEQVGTFLSSEGMTDERVHVCILRVREWKQTHTNFDDDEHVESVWVTWEKLKQLHIVGSNSVIALQAEEIHRLRNSR